MCLGDGDRRRQSLTRGRHHWLLLLLLRLGRPLNQRSLLRRQVSLRWRLLERDSLDLGLGDVRVQEELELTLHLLLHLLQELLTQRVHVERGGSGTASSTATATTTAAAATATASSASTSGVVPEKWL